MSKKYSSLLNKFIGVDVDLTVCPTDSFWLAWLTHRADLCDDLPRGEVDYNLTTYFKQDLKEKKFDPFMYWKDAYKDPNLLPIQGSVEALSALHDKGFNIAFVSAIKRCHYKDKYYWLKKHFPFMDEFIATHGKGYIDCDYFIDDRNKHLNQNYNWTKIKFETPYTQCEELYNPNQVFKSNNWEEIKQYILSREDLYEG